MTTRPETKYIRFSALTLGGAYLTALETAPQWGIHAGRRYRLVCAAPCSPSAVLHDLEANASPCQIRPFLMEVDGVMVVRNFVFTDDVDASAYYATRTEVPPLRHFLTASALETPRYAGSGPAPAAEAPTLAGFIRRLIVGVLRQNSIGTEALLQAQVAHSRARADHDPAQERVGALTTLRKLRSATMTTGFADLLLRVLGYEIESITVTYRTRTGPRTLTCDAASPTTLDECSAALHDSAHIQAIAATGRQVYADGLKQIKTLLDSDAPADAPGEPPRLLQTVEADRWYRSCCAALQQKRPDLRSAEALAMAGDLLIYYQVKEGLHPHEAPKHTTPEQAAATER